MYEILVDLLDMDDYDNDFREMKLKSVKENVENEIELCGEYCFLSTSDDWIKYYRRKFLELSRFFHDILFTVTIYSRQIWREYYINGKYQVEVPEIKINGFDEARLINDKYEEKIEEIKVNMEEEFRILLAKQSLDLYNTAYIGNEKIEDLLKLDLDYLHRLEFSYKNIMDVLDTKCNNIYNIDKLYGNSLVFLEKFLKHNKEYFENGTIYKETHRFAAYINMTLS